MVRQVGFFDVDDRLKRLSILGDQLEAYGATVDFEIFRTDLEVALAYGDGAKGGRPPFDPVMMLKILIIQAQNNLGDDRTEFLINDRLSFMRFLGLSLGDRVPDAKTIWLFRERLKLAGAMDRLFGRFDQAVAEAGYIAMSGQIVDAVAIAARGMNVSPAEIALAWVRDRPGVVAPIVGARTTAQLRTALASEDLELPTELRHTTRSWGASH